MTYAQKEQSQESGQPVEIYRFVLGAETFEYTSGESSIVVDSLTYNPIAISRGPLATGSGERDRIIEVTVPGSNVFAQKYVSVVPGARAEVTIRRLHRTDTPTPATITIVDGFVQSVAFQDNAKVATIAILPAAVATSRPIPKATYQSVCNHILGDARCKVDLTDATWRLASAPVTLVSVNDITVTGASGYSDGWFTGGYVELLSGGDFRLILNHVGNVLSLLLPFPDDITGDNVNVIAGCDHTIIACGAKFFTSEDVTSNVINYGGFAFVPTRNIFRVGLDLSA